MNFAGALVLVLLAIPALVESSTHDHKYKPEEDVVVWVNQVGPYRNPQETYEYYDLPFCRPTKLEDVREGLGEAIQGYELTKSLMSFKFKENAKNVLVCQPTLEEKDIKKFKKAVKNQYWFQLFLDDLPIWGMVGEVLSNPAGDDQYYLFTHKDFSVSYNGNRIIAVNVTTGNSVLLEDRPTKVSFTYSVTWKPTKIAFEDRFDRYLDNEFFEHQIHWFSIFNSYMMVIFLVGLVSMILMRTIRVDYATFVHDELADENLEEAGWKQLHGDVFRPPSNLSLFSALIGTGHQLLLLLFCVLFFSAVGTYYRYRGTIVTAFILCYAFTSCVGGYASGGYYSRNGGERWIKTMFLTATLLPFVCFFIGISLNYVAIAYGSLNHIPASTMLILFAIWAFISLPLTMVGTIIGKNWNGKSNYPCRVNQVPRQIPLRPWYLGRWLNVILGGILPFGSIYIEMYFILSSFWHYKYYYVYGFMLLVYTILILVTVCISIFSVYFLLNAEDYRWHWIAFLSGASTALYVYVYAAVFFSQSNMGGLLQTSFYFGYTLMFALGIAILCGSVGFIGASVFVQRIYRYVKID